MVDEVERGTYNAGLFYTLFSQFFNIVVSNDVCVGFDFVDGDIGWEFLVYLLFHL